MTTTIIVIGTILFLLLAVVAWFVTLVGLPGTWIMVGLSALFYFLVPDTSRMAIGLGVLITLIVLAALGELLEFLASALGVGKAGGSRRGAVLALIGSIVGAIIGAMVGIPIPVIGSLVGVIFFSGLGALVGAFIGEFSHGKEMQQSLKIGKAAFWGRLLGTLSKAFIAAIMLAIITAAVLLK